VILASVVATAAVMAAVLWWLLEPEPPPLADRLTLAAVAFGDLDGWDDDTLGEAAVAFRRSCAALDRQPETRPLGAGGVAGTLADWRPPCKAAAAVDAGDHGAARAFFETWFTPFAATNNGQAEGLFTGYYEPSLDGARTANRSYAIPLHAPPPDLVTVDLGAFRDDLAGRRIAGRVIAGRLEPYPSRAEIVAGALAGQGLELAWVDDPIDAFFLHIQGSGRITMPDGEVMRVGYAGQNGHSYTAIGKVLIARDALSREAVSMQSIRAWLETNPDQADAIMNHNRSYVFFRELLGEGPLGAQGVALSPGRSLAVDRRHVPLSVPVWLETTRPAPEADAAERPLHRLLIAQDTGGAIRGPVRGDVFWGAGAAAAAVAGRMKSEGRYYLLLPRTVAARHAPSG
jgi:membrane-bound lytic murein transglycosylase A